MSQRPPGLLTFGSGGNLNLALYYLPLLVEIRFRVAGEDERSNVSYKRGGEFLRVEWSYTKVVRGSVASGAPPCNETYYQEDSK